jgi:hypothetical protein
MENKAVVSEDHYWRFTAPAQHFTACTGAGTKDKITRVGGIKRHEYFPMFKIQAFAFASTLL